MRRMINSANGMRETKEREKDRDETSREDRRSQLSSNCVCSLRVVEKETTKKNGNASALQIKTWSNNNYSAVSVVQNRKEQMPTICWRSSFNKMPHPVSQSNWINFQFMLKHQTLSTFVISFEEHRFVFFFFSIFSFQMRFAQPR